MQRNRTAVVARVLVVAVLALGLAGCSKSTDKAKDTTVSSDSGSSTTKARPDSDTSTDTDTAVTADTADSADSADTDTADTADSGKDTGMGTDTGMGSTDTVDNGVDQWARTPGSVQLANGKTGTIACPANGAEHTVWGTGPFTDDSSICNAAVFAGLITRKAGGKVTFEVTAGEETYAGGTANGFTTKDYGSWGGSFIFPKP